VLAGSGDSGVGRKRGTVASALVFRRSSVRTASGLSVSTAVAVVSAGVYKSICMESRLRGKKYVDMRDLRVGDVCVTNIDTYHSSLL